MAVAAIAAVGLVAAGISAYGQYQQAQAQAQVYRYNAQVARNNAIAARNAASVEEFQVRERNNRILAAQKARFAKSGLVTTTGSPLAIMSASARQAELDAQIARYRGELGATGFQSQESLLKAQSKSIRQAGVISATSTLLGGVAGSGATAIPLIKPSAPKQLQIMEP